MNTALSPETLSLRELLGLLAGPEAPLLDCSLLDRLPVPEDQRALFTAIDNPVSVGSEAWASRLTPEARSRMLAAFELSRRYASFREIRRKRRRGKIHEPAAFAQVPAQLRSSSKEWIGFIPVHRDSTLGRLCVVETGCRTHVNVDPAELFAPILALRPRAFYLLHNHPAGSPEPSRADWALTEKVAIVASQLGIPMLNHGIVTASGGGWIKPPTRVL